MLFLTTIPGFLFVIAYIIVRVNQGGFAALILKIIASMFFILTALVTTYEKNNFSYGVFIISALIFGLLGDILLDLKWMYPKEKTAYLFSGFFAFIFGHIIFLITLVFQYDFSLKILPLPLLMSLVVAILIAVLEKHMHLKYGKFKILCMFYGFLITLVTTISGFISFKINPLFFIGLILFLISDLILSVTYFGENKNTAPMIASNHLLYYGAQYLIAISILCF